MPKATAKLTVEIEYNTHGTTHEDIYRVLQYGIDHLASNGLLSPLDADIESWKLKVEVEDE